MILLDVASNNSDVVIVSEALDSLFDVFKEDYTDPVAKDIALVDKLKALQSSFKVKVTHFACKSHEMKKFKYSSTEKYKYCRDIT